MRIIFIGLFAAKFFWLDSAGAQQASSRVLPEPSVDELLLQVRDRQHAGRALQSLSERSKDPRVIPALRRMFDEPIDEETKKNLSWLLLHLGVKEDLFFDYLKGFALIAIQDDAPIVYRLDANNVPIPGKVNPDFEKWCQERQLDVGMEAGKRLYGFPSDLLFLRGLDDPRSADLFRQALNSKNPIVVAFSASGLAEFGDTGDISLILLAARNSKLNIDLMAANALALYTSPEGKLAVINATQGTKIYEHLIKINKGHP